MNALVGLIDSVLAIYFWLLIAHVIFTWLAHFGIVNLRQPIVETIGRFLWRITNPVLRPIRTVLDRFLGNLGGIDISPIIVLLLIAFLRNLVNDWYVRSLIDGYQSHL